MEAIQFKGYTIEETEFLYRPSYDYYPTKEGRQDDADYDGESYVYCGNVKQASSLEEAKDAIEEIVMMAQPKHIVIYGDRRSHEFEWLDEAYKFARMFDGTLLPYGQPILNP